MAFMGLHVALNLRFKFSHRSAARDQLCNLLTGSFALAEISGQCTLDQNPKWSPTVFA